MVSIYAGLWGGLLQPAYERLAGRIPPRLALELEASQYQAPERLAQAQWRALGRLLGHASQAVPFYRDWFAVSGISVADLVRARDLSPLPVLERRQLMAEPLRFQARPLAPGTYAKATGGSSGQPLRFLVDPLTDQWRLAMSRRGYAWAGCRPGLRQVYLWAGDFTPPGRLARLKRGLHRALMGQVYIDCFRLDPPRLDQALKLISRLRPACLVAFTSAALTLAHHARQRGWRPPASLAAVITGAEALHAPERALLEEVFACQAFETYGSREFMLMAAECPAHQGLHISMENLYLELLDDQGRPTPPGQVGRVVVTDLHNLAQPFIRYQNDDLAVMAQGPCPCGRTLPRLARVEGRILDQIRTPGGRLVSGTIFPHLLKDFPAVRDYQARQESLDRLVLSVVRAAPLVQADQDRLRQILEGALPGVRVEISLVESIAPTPSGKRRVSIGLGPEGPA